MATSVEVVSETVKAVAAPLSKLIEVVAAGCGKLYEPTHIRRTAHAEGDALLVMEEARIRASDLSRRAAQRLLDIEERRQVNIDAIVERARAALPTEVPNTPVQQDWATRFFNFSQDVSDTDMRLLWGKLLAGEVTHPGTFSPHTLRVVADMTANEARAFEALCCLRFKSNQGSVLFLNIGRATARFSRAGLDFNALLRLAAAGLITMQSGGYLRALGPMEAANFEAPGGLVITLHNKEPYEQSISLGEVLLTPSGEEMATLAAWKANADHVTSILNWTWGTTLQAQISLVETDASGEQRRAPVEKNSAAWKRWLERNKTSTD